MGTLKKNCRLSYFSLLNKIIFLQISLFCIYSCPVTFAVRQHHVPLNDSDGFLFQRTKQSIALQNDSSSNGTGNESILDDPSKKVRHTNREKSRGKKHGNSLHDKEDGLQETIFEKFSNGPYDDEPKRTRLYLLMAQEEAKCLQDFGEIEHAVSFDFPQDLFRPFVCSSGSQYFSACEQCIKIIRGVSVGDTVPKAASCQNACVSPFKLPNCTQRCEEFLQKLINETTKVQNGTGAHGNSRCNQSKCNLTTAASEVERGHNATIGTVKYRNITLTANVFCESYTKSLSQDANYQHFVYLKSLLIDEGGENLSEDVSVVFVIEERKLVIDAGLPTVTGDEKGKWTGWRTLGKSSGGLDRIQVAYRQETYQWRVTAVGVRGPLAVATIKSFKTLDGYVKPGPPSSVFVIENKPKDSTVDVLVGWDPPKERACFYKIVLVAKKDDEPPRTIRIRGALEYDLCYQMNSVTEPLGVHKLWFRDLKLDSTYDVRLTSRNSEWHEYESTQASLSYTTPTCLDTHQFRFDKCAPPPPRNLTFHVKTAGYCKVKGTTVNPKTWFKKCFTAQLTWKSPAHWSETNRIEQYVVEIRAFSWNLPASSKRTSSKHGESISDVNDPQYRWTPRRLHLPGNLTHVMVDNLAETVEYTVLVVALSSMGSSPAAALTMRLHSAAGSLKATVSFWVYPCSILLTHLAIAFGCYAVKRISQRARMKAARDSYFKSLDKQGANAVDWSVVSLTEDPKSTWKVLEDSNHALPKNKWQICFQDLTVGDIIGKGEFGIVREAKIRREMYLELQNRCTNRIFSSRNKTCDPEFGDDKTGMATVALKMLKVAGTKTDIEDLMSELTTMQSLGMHPQIVTLLGMCHTPTSMCIVLEYCPGGDLLSFLRKCREKTNPMWKMRNSNETEDQLQQVCYTELDSEISSSTRESYPSDERIEVVTQEAHTDTLVGIGDETSKTEPITQKDVLSYARQITLGMAYLERNHVVHRDLACRNILLMGDHTRVKISDFGLSRDIYTRNVYQQTTERKLPPLEFSLQNQMWSYGIVLWELVTLGAMPYASVGNRELLELLKTGNRMEQPDNCSDELYALMLKCWRECSADRPKFTELTLYLEKMMETEPELYLKLQP